jgi:hypothetical protein
MTSTAELRHVRKYLQDGRYIILDAFIEVNNAVKQCEAAARKRLAATLQTTDEFAAPSNHEDYQPGQFTA